MNAVQILFAAHSGSQGGAELCLDTTLRHLDRSRFRATVVFAWDGPMAESARQLGWQVEVMRWAWWIYADRNLWYWKNLTVGAAVRIRRLVQLIRQRQIDLVYTNTATIFEPAVAARLAGVPHVWHVHEVLTDQHTRPRLVPIGTIKRRLAAWSDRVIFESRSSQSVCRDVIPEGKSLFVHNSVRFDGGVCNADRGAVRERLGLEPTKPVVAWVGRFSERKNPLLMIEAIARGQLAGQATFVFAGEGPLESPVRQRIAERGLDGACRLIGFQHDVRPLLQAADLLVLTSREESFGLVLIEAGACGRPVVATRTQGPTEIVVEGATGFLVDVDDVGGLADKVRLLMRDEPLRRRMGEAAARRVEELFSPEKNTRKIEQVIDEVIEDRKRKAMGRE